MKIYFRKSAECKDELNNKPDLGKLSLKYKSNKICVCLSVPKNLANR